MGNLLHDPKIIMNLLTNSLDIFLVLFVIYKIFRLMHGTKGILFLNAAIILVSIYAVSRYLNLVLFLQLLNMLGLMLVVSLPIIFQMELRRAVEVFGEKNLFIKRLVHPPAIAVESIDIIVDAAASLAKNRIGALIVLQQYNPLPVVNQSGSRVDAILSKILIEQMFYPNSPLHDGAIVIKDNRIQAAGCFLPLNNELSLPQELGSRHRAGLSLSTQSDAIVIVVSEETGKIAMAHHSVLNSYTPEKLKLKLHTLLGSMEETLSDTAKQQDGKVEVK